MIETASLGTVLAQIRERWGTPGLAAALVDHDKTYSCCLGTLNLDDPQAVRTTSTFCTASVSKVFTATAVMQLVESGQIDLDLPVNAYLPEFFLQDERSRWITPRQLLSHISGMPDESESDYVRLYSQPEYDAGAVERYLLAQRQKTLISKPGTRFIYSNIGYNVLGALISRVSGETFEEYMRQNVLFASGMRSSTFLPGEIEARNLARPHIRAPYMQVSSLYPYHRADAPSSSLHSDLNDLCIWARFCLGVHQSDGRNVLRMETLHAMWQPVVYRGHGLYQHMATGWNTGVYRGQPVICHGGQGAGLSAFLALLPERKQAAICLINEESPVRQRVVEALLDVLLGREPQLGSLSWLVPVSRALAAGGINAARQAAQTLLVHRPAGIEIDEGGLLRLGQQLLLAGRVQSGIEILRLNLKAFPASDDTRECLRAASRHAGDRVID